MKNLMKSVAAAAVIATSATGAVAQQASLSTDVSVSLPEVIVLSCFDSVAVNVSAAALSTAAGIGDTEEVLAGVAETAVGTDGQLTVGLDAASGAAAINSAVNLAINNVCAFRALVTNGVDVTVANGTGVNSLDLVGSTGGESIGFGTVALTTAASVPATSLGLGVAPTPISVSVPLDLANATAAGTYTAADAFTVTVAPGA